MRRIFDMDDIAVKVSDVYKSFKLPHEKQSSVKSLLLNAFRRKSFEKQQVLDNINFEVKKGEFFGIVGRNGGGKSTTLKLLAGIYTPDKGAVVVNGKLTAFIELGVGFNPELTGRENIYLSGALLGFSEKEVDGMYDDIVNFAELHRFMDQKLKNYSSGMQVRLAFSIAIRVKSDVLILDEVLAVGDEAFQRKCLDVFERYKAEKQTVILVTHDMETVRNFCSRAMLINEGRIEAIGNPRDIAKRYSSLNQVNIDSDVAAQNISRIADGVLDTEIVDSSLKPKIRFNVDDKMTVVTTWPIQEQAKMESIGINIFKSSGEHVTGINSRTGNFAKDWYKKGKLIIEFTLNLKPGKYYVVVEAFDYEGRLIDSIIEGPQFTVADMKMTWSGMTQLQHKWK